MIGDAFAEGLALLDDVFGRPQERVRASLMGVVQLAAQESHNVDDGVGLLVEQRH